MHSVVVIPVKRFDQAKRRLGPSVSSAQRELLARRLARGVVAAARPLDVVVVCDDERVREWARRNQAEVVWTPHRGLNGAVREAVGTLSRNGVDHVIITHSDLPLIVHDCFSRLGPWPGVTIVPDRYGGGTNVMAFDPSLGVIPSYGARSFSRHCAQVARRRLGLKVVRDPRLAWDIDYPEDLNGLAIDLSIDDRELVYPSELSGA